MKVIPSEMTESLPVHDSQNRTEMPGPESRRRCVTDEPLMAASLYSQSRIYHTVNLVGRYTDDDI